MKLTIIAPIFIMTLAMMGCASTGGTVTTRTVPIAVPILYSPAPPIVARPTLPTDGITSATPDGEIVKDYAADVQALLGYSVELETIIAQYKNISDAYAGLKAKVAADWKAKTGQDLVIPPQTVVINPSAPTPTK